MDARRTKPAERAVYPRVGSARRWVLILIGLPWLLGLGGGPTKLRIRPHANEPAQHSGELEPCESAWTKPPWLERYHQLVRQALLPGHRETARLRGGAVVLPSFQPEWSVVFLHRDDGKQVLELRTMERSVWGVVYPHLFSAPKAGPPAELVLPPVRTKELNVKTNVADVLNQAFSVATRRARAPDRKLLGEDGTHFFFLGTDLDGLLTCGTSWSPQGNTTAARLSSLVFLLKEVVLSDGGEDQQTRIHLRAQELLDVMGRPSEAHDAPADAGPKPR